MKGEIEIFKNEDEIVEFGIHDTEFRVCIETETYWQEEAVSFNGFTTKYNTKNTNRRQRL